MTMDETIKRINELYHKSKKEGLSEEEKQEQKKLRQDYIDSVKKNLQGQLDHMEIQGKAQLDQFLAKRMQAHMNDEKVTRKKPITKEEKTE